MKRTELLLLSLMLFPNIASGFWLPDPREDPEEGYGVRMLWDAAGQPLSIVRNYVGWPIHESSHELGVLLDFPKWREKDLTAAAGAFYRYNVPLVSKHVSPFLGLDASVPEFDLGLEAGVHLALLERMSSAWGSDGMPGGIWHLWRLEAALRLQAGIDHRPALGVSVGLNAITWDSGN